ncbi:hypothetical protein EBT25_17540 [bacterium]|nr:hypothetical protein [bacterium]
MKVVLKKSPNWIGLFHCIDLLRFVGVSEEIRDKISIKLDGSWLERFFEKLHKWRTPKDVIIIHPYDTWAMDHTLAKIIVPMLEQLKKTNHGAPLVDDDDVPQHLRSTAAPPKENEWDVDANTFLRWNWVMDEMIWSFKQILKEDEEPFCLDSWKEKTERADNGLRLFGKYYRGLWD